MRTRTVCFYKCHKLWLAEIVGFKESEKKKNGESITCIWISSAYKLSSNWESIAIVLTHINMGCCCSLRNKVETTQNLMISMHRTASQCSYIKEILYDVNCVAIRKRCCQKHTFPWQFELMWGKPWTEIEWMQRWTHITCRHDDPDRQTPSERALQTERMTTDLIDFRTVGSV